MRRMFALAVFLLVAAIGIGAMAQVTITIYADDTRTPLLRQVGADYTDATGVLIEVIEFPNSELRSQYITATQAQEGPDIVVGANDWVGELVANGLIEAMDIGARSGDFSSAALQAFSIGEALYALPYAVENIALIYDKDVVPVPPRTWDELLAIARSLYDPDTPMYGLVFENTSANFYQFFPMLSAAGGYIFGFDEDGEYDPCDVGVGNEGAIFGANLYKSMIDEGLIPIGVNGDTEQALIEGRNAAMFITGPWRLVNFQNADINYGITRIPAITGPDGAYNIPKVFAGYQGFFLSSFSENKTIAVDFLLNYIATPATMTALEEIGNRPTVFLPAVPSSPADLLAFGDQGAFSVPMPSIPEMASVWQEGGNAIDLINAGTAPSEAFGQAQQLILSAVGCP